MKRPILAIVACAAMLATYGWSQKADPQTPPFPAGKWRVEFANKVVETAEIGTDGTCWVDEPQRRSEGVAVEKGGAYILKFGDDRMEKWTRVGLRFVVEHFYPGSRVPSVTPVLGIAERTE